MNKLITPIFTIFYGSNEQQYFSRNGSFDNCIDGSTSGRQTNENVLWTKCIPFVDYKLEAHGRKDFIFLHITSIISILVFKFINRLSQKAYERWWTLNVYVGKWRNDQQKIFLKICHFNEDYRSWNLNWNKLVFKWELTCQIWIRNKKALIIKIAETICY